MPEKKNYNTYFKKRARRKYLNSNRINYTANFEAPLFKLHHRSIVDAGSLRKNKNWQFIRIIHMLLQSNETTVHHKEVNLDLYASVATPAKCCKANQPFGNSFAIFDFGTFKPDVRRSARQCSLNNTQETSMTLANL